MTAEVKPDRSMTSDAIAEFIGKHGRPTRSADVWNFPDGATIKVGSDGSLSFNEPPADDVIVASIERLVAKRAEEAERRTRRAVREVVEECDEIAELQRLADPYPQITRSRNTWQRFQDDRPGVPFVTLSDQTIFEDGAIYVPNQPHMSEPAPADEIKRKERQLTFHEAVAMQTFPVLARVQADAASTRRTSFACGRGGELPPDIAKAMEDIQQKLRTAIERHDALAVEIAELLPRGYGGQPNQPVRFRDKHPEIFAN